MNWPVVRRPRLRLAPKAYGRLCQQVLERDRWRCQQCGTAKHLEVHHIRPRSLLGDDTEANLITLCHSCHQQIHLREVET